MKFISWILSIVVRFWILTFRVEVVGPDTPRERPLVFAFRHGHQMGLLRYPRPAKVAVLTSLSRDGTIQTGVLRSLGFSIVRGSSSRGGDAGLVGLIREARAGASVAIAVDGPRGPRGCVKPGALFVARACGGALVPLAVSASSTHRLERSWDRFMLPLPWSAVTIHRGQAIEVPRNCSSGELESYRAQLEQTLEDLCGREGRRGPKDSSRGG